ncbi:MAG: ATP phosphoribosyltransferase [Candidatus Vogelbacteria bacterium]|nr:ATP phosphoribosyltransferase [Candidatus Vogelbacteria bacterium]
MRIALPKGRLYKDLIELLKEAEITFDSDGNERNYKLTCNIPGVTAMIVKPRAIPQLVALGNFDAGFCGLDLVEENGYENVIPTLDLHLNKVKVVVAVPKGREDILINPPKRPLLIATEYERLASHWALRHGLSHITIQTWGSTEAYAPDIADIVFDCTETGATIAANGLTIIDTILESSTNLIVNRDSLRGLDTRKKIEMIEDCINWTITEDGKNER